MPEGVVGLSRRELDRVSVVGALSEGRLRRREAAERLGLCVRQVKRLVRRHREGGAAGLASGHRNGRSNNALDAGVRTKALELVRERYRDFGPTLASEKLPGRLGIRVSRETLRKWMVEEGLWREKRRKSARVHQSRPRRPQFGELVQVDGSPHRWLEDRAGACTLIVYIDDATSRLLLLRLVPAETVRAYMETLGEYLSLHGRMVALYSDRHSVFRVNSRGREGAPTQFTRAPETLDIEPVHARTPQAKGRVERANQTLQDRLVKELRQRGISDVAAANAYLPAFAEDHNRRFAVPPSHPGDAHRPVLHGAEELKFILCPQHGRVLSKNPACQFRNREYQVRAKGPGYALRGARVTVCEGFDGTVTLLHKGRPLAHRVLARGEPPKARHTLDRTSTPPMHSRNPIPMIQKGDISTLR